jgi:hypothetical protein
MVITSPGTMSGLMLSTVDKKKRKKNIDMAATRRMTKWAILTSPSFPFLRTIPTKDIRMPIQQLMPPIIKPMKIKSVSAMSERRNRVAI